MSFVSKQYAYTPIYVSQTCQARDKYSIILSQGDLLLGNPAVKPLATAK